MSLWPRKILLGVEKIKVVSVETDLEDPYFDGKLKEAALRQCKNEIVIQQDFDERIGGDPYQWEGSRLVPI